MARITIEDCMEQVPNRFQLVRMASIRAKQIKKGARPLIENTENKAVVTSLREIAAGLVKPGDAEVPAEPSYEAEAFTPAPEIAGEIADVAPGVSDVPASELAVDADDPEPAPEG